MSEKRDYYVVLGVERNVDEDAVRRAYRQCALKHHPDRNPGDASAETKFKEATEAYSVLSDKEKRARYDRFGHAGLGGMGAQDFSHAGMGDILSQFQDLFSDFFGGMGGLGNNTRQRRGPTRGQDVRVEATISLKDAMTGCKHEVSVTGPGACGDCGGNGAAPGTKPERCSQCGGAGQVTAQRGFVMFSSPCGRCRGTGEMVAEACRTCRGAGVVEHRRKVLVTFPAGIDSGQRLRVPGQGMPGPPGTASGDLYVDVEMAAQDTFQREGADLGTHCELSFAQAALGTKAVVALPDGSSVSVDIKAGTQPGTVLSQRGKGMPRLNGGRGDLHVVVAVVVPRKLSRKARKLLEEFDQEADAD